jgi:photosynthetic reaction center L subunit
MLSFEGVYRKRGGTFLADIFGDDPFDFWVGRYYVGIFGAISVGATVFGILIIALSVAALRDGDLARVTIGAPLRQYGLGSRRQLGTDHVLRGRRLRFVGAARGRDLP